MLAGLIGSVNGCTRPVTVTIPAPLAVMGRTGPVRATVNRYLSALGHDPVGPMRAARADLGGRSVAGVLGITDDRLLRADLGTVTAARTAARTRGPSTARTDAPADPTAPDADLLAQALADEASGTTTVAEAVRAQLGWADPTAFAVSGTYLNAHLALLAGASTDGAGGIVLTTTETGGNAARAAGLRRPHFATDQAGRPVDPTVEAPMLADGRAPAAVVVVGWRDEDGHLHPDLAARASRQLAQAIAAHARARGDVVLFLPDRPKTAVALDVPALAAVVEACRAVVPAGRRTWVVVDGCQVRGPTRHALAHPDGPVAGWAALGLPVDAVAWTTSKGPGGLPFAAGLTGTAAFHRALAAALDAAESRDGGGFAGSYLCRGDLPDPVPPRLHAAAIAHARHHARILRDLPRLRAWSSVADADLARIRDALAGPLVTGGHARLLPERTDPSVAAFTLPGLAHEDAATVIRLLRIGLDARSVLDGIDDRQQAAGLLAVPVGAPAEDHGPPVLRLAVPVELVHPEPVPPLAARRLGEVVATRIDLLVRAVDRLAPVLADLEAARDAAEHAAPARHA